MKIKQAKYISASERLEKALPGVCSDEANAPAQAQPSLSWGAFDASGKLRAILESESEAYFYVRNRGHMHNGSHREIEPATAQAQQAVPVDWKALAISRYGRMEEYRISAQRLADALSISTTTLETVLVNDQGNIAAKCCIKRNREAIAEWKGGAK